MAGEDLPRALSAKFASDFAYPTIKDRLPVIVTKALDSVCRMKAELSDRLGEEGAQDIKSICGQFSKLKNELQTDKPILPLEDDRLDTSRWNEYLEGEKTKNGGHDPSWFKSPWLLCECYFYRRIKQAVEMSNKLQYLDPFKQQKQTAYESSINAVVTLIHHLDNLIQNVNIDDDQEMKKAFMSFLELSLWGNKCDLSISAGLENAQTTDPLEQMESLRTKILCNQSERAWAYLHHASKNKEKLRVDIILDNAGFELIADLCLAEFLLNTNIAAEVRCHGKAMPWFVSDVTQDDLDWTIEQLACAEDEIVAGYGRKWLRRLIDRQMVSEIHDFWTLPQDFAQMEVAAPDLYKDLSKSNLLIFKGDLNYRKLTGDLKWEHTTPFAKSLRGFCPAPTLALRTLKCDLVVGLAPGQSDEIAEKDKDWMLTGKWAVLQFHGSV